MPSVEAMGCFDGAEEEEMEDVGPTTGKSGEQIGEQIDHQKKKQSEDQRNQGFALSLVAEIILCLFATCVFSKETYVLVWITFGIFLLPRCCAYGYLAKIVINDEEEDDDHDYLKVILKAGVVSAVLPYFIYAALLNTAVVSDCQVVEKQKNITTWTTGTVGTYHVQHIWCETQTNNHLVEWIPFQLVKFIQMLLQYVVPIVFGFIVVKGGRSLDLDMWKAKQVIQLAILDFADLSGFACIPFLVTGHMFFEANPMWFNCQRGLLVFASLAAIFEIVGGVMSPSNRKDKIFSLTSITCLNLPLLLFRGYLYWAGVHVSIIYLVKNILCALLEIGIVCDIAFLMNIAKLIDLLPGVDKASALAEDEKNLAQTKKLLKRQGTASLEERENFKKQQRDVQKKRDAERERQNAIWTLSDVLDISLFGNEEDSQPLQLQPKIQEVAGAMRHFAGKQKSKLTKDEIKNMFKEMHKSKLEEVIMDDIEENDLFDEDDSIDINEFAKFFVTKCYEGDSDDE